VPSTVGVSAAKALEDGRRRDSNCGTAEHGGQLNFSAQLGKLGTQRWSEFVPLIQILIEDESRSQEKRFLFASKSLSSNGTVCTNTASQPRCAGSASQQVSGVPTGAKFRCRWGQVRIRGPEGASCADRGQTLGSNQILLGSIHEHARRADSDCGDTCCGYV
jgi:hypothetical protein